MSSDEDPSDSLITEHQFIQKLCECIQEESAADLDRLLYENHTHHKHAIPEGMISLATCTTTIRNKLERKESPITTLRILVKWNCDLAENKFNSLRTNLLYTFCTVEDIEMVEASFALIEYCILHSEVDDVQYFDCRVLDEDEGLLAVSCHQSVDEAIYQSFQRINEMQERKRQILSIFLLNVFRMDPYHGIVADYCYAPYEFAIDPNDYDPITGQYIDPLHF